MRKLLQLCSSLLTVSFTINTVFAAPFLVRFPQGGPSQVIADDFPDPAFVKPGLLWYAFGSNAYGRRIQVAKSLDFKHWDVLDTDALASLAPWETEVDHWAPDVIERDDGRLVMYYSGEAKAFIRHHCVGAAISEGRDPAGPYHPLEQPFACHLDKGGAIDPAGFLDQDKSRWVVYKVDGNSVGNGGDCNNAIHPLVATPIYLQKVEGDGVTKVGEPIAILDRDETAGPLVEAPSLILSPEGVYFLFYSTHCYTSPKYDVRYATSRSITGPYVKAKESLIKTGDFGLTSPGGATVAGDGKRILFHANCPAGRCMYASDLDLQGETARIV
ncbi:hypothetical protein AJ79_03886 [Helicocarpus griseus UAMH5409]|uniref:Endo-arabinase n=1 Tax=Helicocarpus griseus UAMH5409 TaxID=1447875 RepID=A0A2B7XVR6_9EURO|nr:hypothetical protein AJ79_03886 [Helicocarpus griseus UAMH5409]